MRKDHKNLKGILFAIISSGTFGLIPLFSIPLMQSGMNEPSILFYRFLFSFLMMAIICFIRKENINIPSKQIGSLFTLGLFYSATALFLIYSYRFLPSGISTTIHFIYPIAVSFIMIIFFKEKASLILLLAATLSVIGVVFMCWNGSGSISIKGVVIASITVVTYSVYIVSVNKSKAGRLSAEVLTMYVLLSATLIFLFYSISKNNLDPIPDLGAFIRLLLLSFLCTVVSGFTLVLAIKLVGSTTTSILGSMEPLVAVIIGVIYFSELFNIYSFIGMAIVLLSVIIVIKKNRNSSE